MQDLTLKPKSVYGSSWDTGGRGEGCAKVSQVLSSGSQLLLINKSLFGVEKGVISPENGYIWDA